MLNDHKPLSESEAQNSFLKSKPYRGRIAPSPTGLLHLGHARTFSTAQDRASFANGTLILRIDDLDRSRCQADFLNAIEEDLHWFGVHWTEGPNIGGPYGPYAQSERMSLYTKHFEILRQLGCIYPCNCSRQDVLHALSAPHSGDEDPIYPGTCRDRGLDPHSTPRSGVNWRFRVPKGELLQFTDGAVGIHQETAGTDFGDFLVWRKDDQPSYHLACVVDDAAMEITEVVRGADLLTSTSRQILIYRALNFSAPAFYHCPLIRDIHGTRLAKRNHPNSLRNLRIQGISPEHLRSTANLLAL